MASRKTWIWIGVAVAGTGVLALMAVAGAGIYFVSRHVQTSSSTPPEALRAFEAINAAFEGNRPLYELDNQHKPQLVRPFSSLPTSATKATDLQVQAWNPEDQRLVRLSIPFWLLRFGDRKMRVMRDEGGIDFRELTLDINELGRVGPVMILDYRNQDGVRVLLWTR